MRADGARWSQSAGPCRPLHPPRSPLGSADRARAASLSGRRPAANAPAGGLDGLSLSQSAPDRRSDCAEGGSAGGAETSSPLRPSSPAAWKQTSPAATATFRLSRRPAMGIETARSSCARTDSESPSLSLPSTKTARCGTGCSKSDSGASAASPRHRNPAPRSSANPIARESQRTIGQSKIAPDAARTTRPFTQGWPESGQSSASRPAPTTERTTIPTFWEFVTPSRASTRRGRRAARPRVPARKASSSITLRRRTRAARPWSCRGAPVSRLTASREPSSSRTPLSSARRRSALRSAGGSPRASTSSRTSTPRESSASSTGCRPNTTISVSPRVGSRRVMAESSEISLDAPDEAEAAVESLRVHPQADEVMEDRREARLRAQGGLPYLGEITAQLAERSTGIGFLIIVPDHQREIEDGRRTEDAAVDLAVEQVEAPWPSQLDQR